MNEVISTFTPRILTDSGNPLAPRNVNSTSNGGISLSSSSSDDAAGTVPIPIGPKLDRAPPPPPYVGQPTYQPSSLSKNDVDYLSDNDRNSFVSLEKYDGDQEEENSSNNANTEPLWFHGNIDS